MHFKTFIRIQMLHISLPITGKLNIIVDIIKMARACPVDMYFIIQFDAVVCGHHEYQKNCSPYEDMKLECAKINELKHKNMMSMLQEGIGMKHQS